MLTSRSRCGNFHADDGYAKLISLPLCFNTIAELDDMLTNRGLIVWHFTLALSLMSL